MNNAIHTAGPSQLAAFPFQMKILFVTYTWIHVTTCHGMLSNVRVINVQQKIYTMAELL